MNGPKVTQLVTETNLLLDDCAKAGPGDPSLAEFWEVVCEITNLAGARLMEDRFGRLLPAAGEVQLYLEHLDRVGRLVVDAPFPVPLLPMRRIKAAGRFIETTTELGELFVFLVSVPQLVSSLSAYLTRTQGRSVKPATDVIDLAVRAGGLFRDCLDRSVPRIAA